MESYEALKAAVDEVGAKRVAAEMNLSSSLVYKWCEKAPDQDEASGARNPLDRVRALVRCTRSPLLVEWLCEQADGVFVPNTEATEASVDQEFITHTQQLIHDFSELLRVVSQAVADDNRVDGDEAERIRRKWQKLKQYGERFVRACERGLFG